MAVVKANYVRRGGGAKARAKASIRYIQHRRGEDGQAVTRQLFGSDGPMERDEAYRMIDEAKKGDMFYRLVVSPDPKEEDRPKDLDMRMLTERTIRTLEERAGAARRSGSDWPDNQDDGQGWSRHAGRASPDRSYDIGDGALLRERAVWQSRSTGPRNEFLHANEDLAFCPAATSPTARSGCT